MAIQSTPHPRTDGKDSHCKIVDALISATHFARPAVRCCNLFFFCHFSMVTRQARTPFEINVLGLILGPILYAIFLSPLFDIDNIILFFLYVFLTPTSSLPEVPLVWFMCAL